MSLTTDPNDACLREIEPSGMQKCYLVLSEEERAKGFVRPLRRSYKHVGRTVTLEGADGTTFEQFVPACGATTHMGLALCETFARQPSFYGATYCCHCGTHLPVAEFRWSEDGEVLGT